MGRAVTDEGLVREVSVRKILREWDCNPFEHIVWPKIEQPITREEVAEAIGQGAPQGAVPYDLLGAHRSLWSDPPDREFHVHRVAYLVVHGWSDPIEMDLGCPSLGGYVPGPTQDGNHRFAAVVYQGLPSVRAQLAGEVKWIRRFYA